MKPVWLILLGFICVMQLILVLNKGISSLGGFFENKFLFAVKAITLSLVALLPIFTGTIMSNHFPDKAIAGRKKRNFNIFTFVGFLVIPLLYLVIFKEYQQTPLLSDLMGTRFISPIISTVYELLISIVILVLHLIILFGLYRLRSSIELNARLKSVAKEP